MLRKLLLLGSIVLCQTLTATAQEERSEISLQGTGLFTKNTSGNGTGYSATGAGGFLSTYHFHLNKWYVIEGAYGLSLNVQKFLFSSTQYRIQSRMHQATGSLVINMPSRPSSRVNPYILAGGGVLMFVPTGTQFNTLSGAQSQAKFSVVYGAGFNYPIRHRISFRVEYRGLLYATPDFGFGALSTKSITHTAQPSVGVGFRF